LEFNEIEVFPLISATITSNQLLVINNDLASDSFWGLSGSVSIVFPQWMHPSVLLASPLIPPAISDNDYPVVTDSAGAVVKPYVWYKFDSAGCFTDSSGNGIGLTSSGTPVCSSSKVKRGDSALALIKANSQYAKTTLVMNPSLYTMKTNNGFTITFWGLISSAATFDPLIEDSKMWIFYNSNALQFQTGSDSVSFTTSSDPADGNWHFYVWGIDSSNRWTIHIDSSKLVCPGCNTTKTGIIDASSTSSLFLGSDRTTSRFCNAVFDDFRIYKTVLTDAQVNTLYQGRVGVYTASFGDCPDTTSCASGSKHCDRDGVTKCCGAGQFFRDGIDSACQPCPAGTVSADGAGTSCAPCPDGQYAVNRTQCAPCQAGTSSAQVTKPYLSGGNVFTDVDGYMVHQFLASNGQTTSRDVMFTKDTVADVLVIGGGGSGGSDCAGGGGAGAVLYYSGYKFTAGTYSFTVGSGGASPSLSTDGNPGTDSIISYTSAVFNAKALD